MSDIKPITVDDFKSHVSRFFSRESAEKVREAAVIFTEAVMAAEMRRRIRIRKHDMASGSESKPDPVEERLMEERLAGVLRFSDVLADVFDQVQTPPVPTESVDKAPKKRKKSSGK